MVVLYSTHCPKCMVLQNKLEDKKIEYQLEESVDELIKLGFSQAPILKVGDQYLEFSEANQWINNMK